MNPSFCLPPSVPPLAAVVLSVYLFLSSAPKAQAPLVSFRSSASEIMEVERHGRPVADAKQETRSLDLQSRDRETRLGLYGKESSPIGFAEVRYRSRVHGPDRVQVT